MRADLAAALLHNPQTVYLDEPTIGLDVAVKQKIREFIKTMNREHGTTIMLTTHDLGDLQNLCKRLIIIDHGRIIYNGSIEAVEDRFARERTIHFEMSASAPICILHCNLNLVWSSLTSRKKSLASDSTASTQRQVRSLRIYLALAKSRTFELTSRTSNI